MRELTASDAQPSDWFGTSVDIDGDSVIVGATGDDDNGTTAGAGYVYRYVNDDWDEQSKLTAPDGAAEDLFGYSVGI